MSDLGFLNVNKTHTIHIYRESDPNPYTRLYLDRRGERRVTLHAFA